MTTDGFLHPNAVLEARGLLGRKGFPESYDRRALARFLADVKSGREEVFAPVYDHQSYDVVPDVRQAVDRPDILVARRPQRAAGGTPGGRDGAGDLPLGLLRLLGLRRRRRGRHPALVRGALPGAAAHGVPDTTAYFHRFAGLTDDEARATALDIWSAVNGPNLRDNIAPTRSRARLVLQKAADHSVRRVLLRKL